jgi:hypothetical protein
MTDDPNERATQSANGNVYGANAAAKIRSLD